MKKILGLTVAASALLLAGCVYDDGVYGGVQVGAGANWYDDGYGYYDGAYGYGYGGGWYDGWYYPGTGYYIWDRNGARTRWTDAQRRYWEQHRHEWRDRRDWRRDGDRDGRPDARPDRPRGDGNKWRDRSDRPIDPARGDGRWQGRRDGRDGNRWQGGAPAGQQPQAQQPAPGRDFGGRGRGGWNRGGDQAGQGAAPPPRAERPQRVERPQRESRPVRSRDASEGKVREQ